MQYYLVKIKVNAVSYHRSNTTTYHYKKFYFQDSGKNLQVLFLTSIQVCCRIGESVCVCVCCTLIFRGSTFLHEENASEERCNQIRPSQFCWQWLVRLKIEGSFTVVITFKSHTRRRRRTCAYCEFVCFWRQIEQIDPDNTWGENFHQRLIFRKQSTLISGFCPNECPGVCQYRTEGIHQRKKKQQEMKNEKKDQICMSFCIPKLSL